MMSNSPAKLTIDRKFVGSSLDPFLSDGPRFKQLTDSIWLIPGENPGTYY